MTQFLISVLAFLIAIGILVTVHEFGHFWVARKLGVRVLRFSIGFGKPLWRYQADANSTEYVVAALPLGGYVKMLDEREGEVASEERHLAFNTQPVGSRIAIVVAGPAFNILLACLLYTLVFTTGITGLKPLIGAVQPDSPAAIAGFNAGEEITAVDATATQVWQEVRLATLEAALASQQITMTVIDADGQQHVRTIDLHGLKILKDEGDIIEKLGLQIWQPTITPIIDQVVPDSAAQRAGLQSGDLIRTVNQQSISDWRDWVEYVRARPLQTLELEVLRGEQVLEVLIALDSKRLEDGSVIGIAGVSVSWPAEAYAKMQQVVRYPVWQAAYKGVAKTWDMTLLTFGMLGKLLIGDASPKNISGPLTIAEYAGKYASVDLSYFLDFLALISVGLAVLNILPIPLLDGGHLLYYLLEIVKGSPVSERTQWIGQNLGIVILAALMSLAFYNDIMRLLG